MVSLASFAQFGSLRCQASPSLRKRCDPFPFDRRSSNSGRLLSQRESVAEAAQLLGNRIAVIAAGERWPDGSLRPAVEDWLGAGAIIHHLKGTRSPEAASAAAAFSDSSHSLVEHLQRCSSGRELIERGFESDISYAADLDISATAPILRNGGYAKFSIRVCGRAAR